MVTTMAKMTNVQNTEILDKVNSEQVRLAVAEIKSAASSASKAILHLADVLYKWSNKSDWVEIERRLTAERIFDMSIVKRIILIGSNGVLMKKEYCTVSYKARKNSRWNDGKGFQYLKR